MANKKDKKNKKKVSPSEAMLTSAASTADDIDILFLCGQDSSFRPNHHRPYFLRDSLTFFRGEDDAAWVEVVDKPLCIQSEDGEPLGIMEGRMTKKGLPKFNPIPSSCAVASTWRGPDDELEAVFMDTRNPEKLKMASLTVFGFEEEEIQQFRDGFLPAEVKAALDEGTNDIDADGPLVISINM